MNGGESIKRVQLRTLFVALCVAVVFGIFLMYSRAGGDDGVRADDGFIVVFEGEATTKDPARFGISNQQCQHAWTRVSKLAVAVSSAQHLHMVVDFLRLRELCVEHLVMGITAAAAMPISVQFREQAVAAGVATTIVDATNPKRFGASDFFAAVWADTDSLAAESALVIFLDITCPSLYATTAIVRKVESLTRAPAVNKTQQCLWLMDNGLYLSSAIWKSGCARLLGPVDKLLSKLWLADLTLRQLAALEVHPLDLWALPPRSNPQRSSWIDCARLPKSSSERLLFREKWGPREHFGRTVRWAESAAFISSSAYAFKVPYGLPFLHPSASPIDPRDNRAVLDALVKSVAADADGAQWMWAAAELAGSLWLRAAKGRLPRVRRIPLLVLGAHHSPADAVQMLNLSVTVGFSKLTVIFHEALEGTGTVAVVRLFRILSGLWSQIAIVEAPSAAEDEARVVHRLPPWHEGPLLQTAVRGCVVAIDKEDSLHLGDDFCIAVRDPTVAASSVESISRIALSLQHAVPFVFSVHDGVVTDRYFAILPRAADVPLDVSLATSEMLLLDAALRLRTTILGYVAFDAATGAITSGPFTFLSRPLSRRQQDVFYAKWRFNVSLHGGDPSGVNSSAALVAPKNSASAAFLACQTKLAAPDGEACKFLCSSCASAVDSSSDLLTLALNTAVFAPMSLANRLANIAAHLTGRLRLARDTNFTAPVIPMWGSLIVPKDFGHWLNLMQSNTEAGVWRYVVVLNRADERIHRFMIELQQLVALQVGCDWAFQYSYHPENLGIADGWNYLGASGFDDILHGVDWMIIMNNDITLRRGALADFAANTEILKDLVVTHNLLGFASFAITKFGWRTTGRFDSNLWPAYATDVEYLSRIKSRGLLRADFAAKLGHEGDVVHAVSVTSEDVVFMEWVHRWHRAEYMFRKWGVDVNAVPLGIENYPVQLHPFGISSLPHNATCLEPEHRQCIKTFTGPQYIWSRQCFFNTARLVEVCGVDPKEEQSWWRNARLLRDLHKQRPAYDFDALVSKKVFPALTAGVRQRNASLRQGSSECFIPILVLVIFREVDRLHDFLMLQPCSIGALVLRVTGPGSRARGKVITFFTRLIELLDPAAAATRRNQRQGFSEGLLDVAQLDRLKVSVGGAFADAMFAEVLNDIFGRVQKLRESEDDVPADVKPEKAVDYCSDSAPNRWKRWALLADVEQGLHDAAELGRLARWMDTETRSADGCRKSIVSLVTENFFAVSMSALKRVSAFKKPRGYGDVSGAFMEELRHVSNVTVDRQFAGASTLSGYKLRPFEPFI
jgi:hypothetical protein